MAEKYITEAKERLDREADYVIDTLIEIAEELDIDKEWTVQTFRDKFAYKISKLSL